jgi:very-short-patch-repair endonuclease
MEADALVLAGARARHGLISREAAIAAGLSRHQIQQRIERGSWERLHRGVYAVAGAPRTYEQQVLAACLATKGTGSHRSSMVFWDVEPDDRVAEVTVRQGRTPYHEGILVHRSLDLRPEHISVRSGIPVTNPLRMLADVGAVLPVLYVERCIEQGLARRLFTQSAIVGVRWELSKQGRTGLGALEEAIRRQGFHLGNVESVLEAAFARLCVAYDLPAPELQHEVVVGGRRRRIDAAWPDLMLAVEVDGFASRIDRERFQDDRTRQNALVEAGWTVIRFTWEDVMQRPQSVARQILQVLRGLVPQGAAQVHQDR